MIAKCASGVLLHQPIIIRRNLAPVRIIIPAPSEEEEDEDEDEEGDGGDGGGDEDEDEDEDEDKNEADNDPNQIDEDDWKQTGVAVLLRADKAD